VKIKMLKSTDRAHRGDVVKLTDTEANALIAAGDAEKAPAAAPVWQRQEFVDLLRRHGVSEKRTITLRRETIRPERFAPQDGQLIEPPANESTRWVKSDGSRPVQDRRTPGTVEPLRHVATAKVSPLDATVASLESVALIFAEERAAQHTESDRRAAIRAAAASAERLVSNLGTIAGEALDARLGDRHRRLTEGLDALVAWGDEIDRDSAPVGRPREELQGELAVAVAGALERARLTISLNPQRPGRSAKAPPLLEAALGISLRAGGDARITDAVIKRLLGVVRASRKPPA
jgi:hypothetical protein